MITAGTATAYEDTGLEAGEAYYYSIRAHNDAGAGAWSDLGFAVAAASNPEAPSLTATAIGTTSIRLSWTVPEDNGTVPSPAMNCRCRGMEYQSGTPDVWATANLLVSDTFTNNTFDHTGLDVGHQVLLPSPRRTAG